MATSRWSWRIGSLAGVPIRVHVTLLLLLAWVATSSWIGGVGSRATLFGVLLFAAVFVVIVAHELAHALMARHFGVRTREILLLPIGGIASLERIPDRPRQELAIALVGPALNLVLAAVLWLGLAFAGAPVDPNVATSFGQAFAAQFMWINLVLAGFNLIPAFPLDGGRAFRAVLTLVVDRDRATGIAAGAGKVLALALGLVGIVANPWLVVIALVIWLGATRERDLVRIRTSLTGVPVRDVMASRIEVVDVHDSIADAASRMMAAGAEVAPLVDRGRVAGALTRADLAEGLRAIGPDAVVAAGPMHDVVRVAPDASLDRVLDALEAAPGAVAVVVDGETPVGLVTPDQLAAYAALHAGPRGRATA